MIMQTAVKLYSLGYSDIKTYMVAALFIAGNIVLPQLCHLIPQGGMILLPIYFFTLIAAYKFGWKAGLLTAVLSPVVNSLCFGMPALALLPVILVKSSLLAVFAALAASRFQKVSLLLLAAVVVAYQLVGGVAEWAITGSLDVALQDFRLGEVIQSKIYEIRGQRVMLDRDLAEMYGVETRVLNQAVKRNIERFPEDFMFQLTDEEVRNWKSQFVMSNSIKMGLRKNPYAFTELGVAMLSSVLNSKIAIQVNMGIMRAFVALRQLVAANPVVKFTELQNEITELKGYIEEMFADQNDINEDTRMQLELINQTLAELQTQDTRNDRPRRRIGFVPPGE